MSRGLEKPAVLGVGDFGEADIKGLEADLVGWGFVGIPPRFVRRRSHEVPPPGDQPEADGLDLQGFLGLGGPDGQQQPANQKEPAFGFSSVNFAATISREFFKTLHYGSYIASFDAIDKFLLRAGICFRSGMVFYLGEPGGRRNCLSFPWPEGGYAKGGYYLASDCWLL